MVEQLEDQYRSLMQVPEFRVVIVLTVLAIFVAFATYGVLKIRGQWGSDMQVADDHLAKFREMHEQGALDDDEFRKLKSELNKTLCDELNLTGQADKTDQR